MAALTFMPSRCQTDIICSGPAAAPSLHPQRGEKDELTHEGAERRQKQQDFCSHVGGEPMALLGSEFMRDFSRGWLQGAGCWMGWALLGHIWEYHLCTCTWQMGRGDEVVLIRLRAYCRVHLCVHGGEPSV